MGRWRGDITVKGAGEGENGVAMDGEEGEETETIGLVKSVVEDREKKACDDNKERIEI